MKNLPLVLSVARDLPMDRGEVFLSQKIIDYIHKRDKNTCLFCGWREKHTNLLNVTSLNNSYKNNSNPSQLVTSCHLCNLSLRLVYAFQSNSGSLIYMPELTQAQVNELARAAFFCTKVDDSGVNEALEPLLSYVEDERIAKVSEYFGIVPFKLQSFASSLREIDEEQYLGRQKFIGPIRFWPNLERLNEIVGEQWDHVLSRVPLAQWVPLANRISKV